MIRRNLGSAALVAITTLLSGSASALTGGANCSTVHMQPGSTVLHHPNVVLIYWGSQWSRNSPSMGTLTAQVQDMMSGPYFSPLNQYYGIRSPRLDAQVVSYTSTSPSNGFSETPTGSGVSVVEAIQGAMNAGSVPPANVSADNFYLVVVPHGLSSNQTFSGRHGNYPATNGVWYPFAWVTDTGGPYMQTLSHELVEGITDPWAGGKGTWTDCGGSENEIADICSQSETQHGYVLSSYWSAADNACVIPEKYQAFYGWDGSTFQNIGSNGGQKVFPGYVNGTPVTVATDASDNVYLALGFPPTWYQIGGPGGAMYAVGNDSIYALANDGSRIARWNGGTSWSSIGLPNGFVTGIYGGAYPAATDMFGDTWIWSQSANKWSLVAGINNQAAQVIENGQSLNILSKNYGNVWQYKGSGLTGLQLNTFTELIAGGGNNTLLAATNTNSSSALDIFAGGTTWNQEAPPPFAFSVPSNFSPVETYVVAANNLYAFSGDHQTVAQCNDPTASQGGWTNLSKNVTLTRIYGQTGTLVATGAVGY